MVGDTAPKRWRIIVNFLALLTVISLVVSSWALVTRFNETNRLRDENAKIWHAVVCDIEVQVGQDKKLSHSRKVFVLRFYDRLLMDDAHAAPCGLVSEVK
jgi:hypothetical protein